MRIPRRMAPPVLSLALAAGCVGSGAPPAGPPPGVADEVVSVFREGEIPWDDPAHACWHEAPETQVRFIRQEVQEPKLAEASIERLRVRSLHNASEIAFRLEWEDATRDAGLRSDRFADAAAVQFPLSVAPLPDYRMGDTGKPVHLMYWRADRQRSREEKVDYLKENYPNAWVDAYPFEPKTGEGTTSQASATEQRECLAARAAGNPSAVGAAPTVEELSAETWNRMTVQPSQDARGKGVWKDGRWRLVMVRPLAAHDPQDAPLASRRSWSMALAVWDGSRQNTGSRKMVTSAWVPLTFRR